MAVCQWDLSKITETLLNFSVHLIYLRGAWLHTFVHITGAKEHRGHALLLLRFAQREGKREGVQGSSLSLQKEQIFQDQALLSHSGWGTFTLRPPSLLPAANSSSPKANSTFQVCQQHDTHTSRGRVGKSEYSHDFQDSELHPKLISLDFP